MGFYSIPAKWHGGRMVGVPKFCVVHSAETPLAAGYARAIGNYFAHDPIKTSAHEMVDPRDVVSMVADSTVAWHCGNGNRRSLGFEQAGYARFARSDWLTPPGEAQMRLLAGRLAKRCRLYGIPARWASDAQLLAAHRGGPAAGFATHAQCSRVLGGSTHSDPMPHYPLDELLDLVREELKPAPVKPVPPVKKPPTLGDTMAKLDADDLANIDRLLRKALSDFAATPVGRHGPGGGAPFTRDQLLQSGMTPVIEAHAAGKL